MTTFEVPASVAANVEKRRAADRSRRPCLYGCRADARPYTSGTFCDEHAPWALAGRPNPDSQIDPTRTLDALRARMQQPDADVRAIRAQPAEPVDTITQRFLTFHVSNPHVMDRLLELVDRHVSQGARRLGIGALFEELRGKVETTGRHYSLDNSLRAPYVRALIADRPDYADLFELRQRKSA